MLTNVCTNRLFGFLLGSVVAGSSVYSYLLSEYKISNDLLTEDIYVRIAIPSFLDHPPELNFDQFQGDKQLTVTNNRLFKHLSLD